MALDGAFLHVLSTELARVALGARIDKISQPTRDCLIIALRWKGGSGKLLLSASAQGPRLHFTDSAPENPKAAPMFCMLLRKHLGAGRLVGVEQMGLDRVLHLQFETANELGDLVVITVAVEIMGRHSNIVVIGPDGKIIDAIKRVGLDMSEVRQILPGMTYTLPPAQNKLNLLTTAPKTAAAFIVRQGEMPLSKAVLQTLEGFSPIICREAAFAACGEDRPANSLTANEEAKLEAYLGSLKAMVETGEGCVPTALFDETGRAIDFAFTAIRQYGAAATAQVYPSCGTLLEGYYAGRETTERARQRSGDLRGLVQNAIDRITRKLQSQQEELSQSARRENLKIYGDLLTANLHTIPQGSAKAEVANFYETEAPPVSIPLDPFLSPAQNAQKYYSDYRKAQTAEKMLIGLIQQAQGERAYLETVQDALNRALSEAEITAIREELETMGYLRRRALAGRKAPKAEAKLPPLQYRSSDGFVILCGRNNLQNDRLTLKDAHSRDIWFHTQKIPGSHVVVVTGGAEVPPSTLEEAAVIAAYNSKAGHSAKVPVDYTLVKNVKKPPGARPGFVIYDPFQTAIVTPDEKRVSRLRTGE